MSSSPLDPVLTVTVDQADADYAPGETVGITAGNVAVGGTLKFTVANVDGPGPDGVYGTSDDVLGAPLSGSEPWIVTDGGAGDADGVANGQIVTSWQVNQDAVGERFLLSAAEVTAGDDGTFGTIDDGQTGEVATTTFTDAIKVEMGMWANGPAPDADGTGGNDEAWVNGNINASKSHYSEDELVPVRYEFTGLTVGQTYTISI